MCVRVRACGKNATNIVRLCYLTPKTPPYCLRARKQIKQACVRRRARLEAQGLPLPARDFDMIPHVVHVSPDGRKVYIGDEYDVTRNGTRIMFFNKSWNSLPIQSWSGGRKLADAPGEQRVDC